MIGFPWFLTSRGESSPLEPSQNVTWRAPPIRDYREDQRVEMTEDERDLQELNIEITEPKKETIVEEKVRQFQQLSHFLNHWYYKPDISAVKVCLSAYVAHTYLSDNPVWLFIIGPPGSGKTSVAIRSVAFLRGTEKITDLTTNSFLSGFGENNGILARLTKKTNGNGVLLFPDFTSLLAKKEDVRNEIVGQMRRIYDGEYEKQVGNKGELMTWKGKVTCLAAVTPALEDYWAINRSLGERFMYLRWRGGAGKEAARYAKRQVGKETIIADEFEKRVLAYVDYENLKSVSIPEDEDLGFEGLAELVSRFRGIIKREVVRGKRIISGVDECETPTRISKMLTMIARGSATLDRRAKIDYSDIEIAKRVAVDSIPVNRGKIFEVLLDDMNYESTLSHLMLKSGLHKSTVERTISDLVALKIVSLVENGNRKFVVLAPDIVECWEDSIIANVYEEPPKPSKPHQNLSVQ